VMETGNIVKEGPSQAMSGDPAISNAYHCG
jgi:hypothetical protein